jgi:cytidine deaminase
MGMEDSDVASDDGSVLAQLRATAQRAEVMNWSPYTGAVVTAAVYTTSGLFHGGSNVEVANISLSKHAEEAAVMAALATGALHHGDSGAERQFITAVYTTAPPCGSCRQFLYEFATDDCVVYIDDGPEPPTTMALTDLMPRPFGPEEQSVLQRQRHDA